MNAASPDLEGYRRHQRRRARIGWIGGILALPAVIVLTVLTVHVHVDLRRTVDVPSGEIMSSSQYGEVAVGEDEADVLERLDASGRPEGEAEPYVLQLFPPAGEEVRCTYWEFSDKPEFFARLCFSRSDGELVEKEKHSLLESAPGTGGQIV